MRRKARVDDNHSKIVRVLRDLGCKVLDLSRVGSGCPDLLVSVHGELRLVEVKDGEKPPSKRRLTPDQIRFAQIMPFTVIKSIQEAVDFVNDRQKKAPS